jgi:hypothetical protein
LFYKQPENAVLNTNFLDYVAAKLMAADLPHRERILMSQSWEHRGESFFGTKNAQNFVLRGKDETP